jgi:outer membrane PBP1 activator LpoA protein
MVKMKKLMMALVAAVALSGCAQQTFKINNGIAEKPTQEVKQSFFVHGIGQSKTIDAALVCGGADKVIRTEVQESGMDVFLRIITIGIYTPREARVYCAK